MLARAARYWVICCCALAMTLSLCCATSRSCELRASARTKQTVLLRIDMSQAPFRGAIIKPNPKGGGELIVVLRSAALRREGSLNEVARTKISFDKNVPKV